jgi:cation:H+ antiporter
MIWYAIGFLIGIAILLKSTDVFVRLSERLAGALRISPLIVGTTIIAIGTSLPELSVSLVSAVKNDAGLALGNLVGSNIINIFLVLPIGILMGGIRIGTTKTQKNILMLGAVTLTFFLLYELAVPHRLAGMILLMVAVLVTVVEYAWGVRGRDREDAGRRNRKPVRMTGCDYATFALAGSGIVGGGICTVLTIERIAFLSGLSTTLFGLTVVAIATSLPELFATIVTEREHEDKITVGDIIGSNIYNLSLIGGLSLLFAPWNAMKPAEYWMLVLATFCLIAILHVFRGRTVRRRVGVLLLGMCLLYIVLLR